MARSCWTTSMPMRLAHGSNWGTLSTSRNTCIAFSVCGIIFATWTCASRRQNGTDTVYCQFWRPKQCSVCQWLLTCSQLVCYDPRTTLNPLYLLLRLQEFVC